MSAADDAYRAAEAAIAEAKRTGAEELNFDDEAFQALETLPRRVNALDKLRNLDLRNTQVSDLDPLEGMTGLQWLWLDNTQVSDLDPLKGVTGLQVLSLDNTQVSNLDPLKGMRELQTLWLSYTQVSDLSPVKGMTGLQTLTLNNTHVLDLRPLAGLRKLADEPKYGGLLFRGIPATADPKIAEIAVIEDYGSRAKALFALLDAGWVPPVPVEPDPLLRSILIDGQL
jgi:Leucine-rich repeat (LRR) protein